MATKATGLIFNPSASVSAMTALDIQFKPSLIVSARKLDKLGLDIRSMREPLRRCVQEVIIPSIRKNFDAGGRDPKWPALSPETQRTRAQQGYSPNVKLVRTGHLRRKMGYINIWHIDREKAFIKDLPHDIWYGKVHQAGAQFRIPSGGFKSVSVSYLGKTLGQKDSDSGGTGYIPPRPFVVLRRMDEIQMQRIFNQWLGERLKKARLG